MSPEPAGTNTLYHDLQCPYCGQLVRSGIGFRLGSIGRHSYKLGDMLAWDGPHCRPASRPQDGTVRTIGYFNCDNPGCQTWQDCYPEVQEAVVTVVDGVIADVSVTVYKPGELTFAILEQEQPA